MTLHSRHHSVNQLIAKPAVPNMRFFGGRCCGWAAGEMQRGARRGPIWFARLLNVGYGWVWAGAAPARMSLARCKPDLPDGFGVR